MQIKYWYNLKNDSQFIKLLFELVPLSEAKLRKFLLAHILHKFHSQANSWKWIWESKLGRKLETALFTHLIITSMCSSKLKAQLTSSALHAWHETLFIYYVMVSKGEFLSNHRVLESCWKKLMLLKLVRFFMLQHYLYGRWSESFFFQQNIFSPNKLNFQIYCNLQEKARSWVRMQIGSFDENGKVLRCNRGKFIHLFYQNQHLYDPMVVRLHLLKTPKNSVTICWIKLMTGNRNREVFLF